MQPLSMGGVDDEEQGVSSFEEGSSGIDSRHRERDRDEPIQRAPPYTTVADRMYARIASSTPPSVVRAIRWLYGDNATPLGEPRPWLRVRWKRKSIALEPLWIRWTRRFTSPVLLGVLIAAYIISLSFFARAQWYETPADDFADCTSAFWQANNGCGLNGQNCLPFNSSQPIQFRCPAACPSVILANQRAVGDLEVVYKPLVVGGGDELGTYRGDSWLCVAAVHAGKMTSRQGGCAAIELVGEFKNFLGGRRHGIDSVDFPTTFPLSYRFLPQSGLTGCIDMRYDGLAFNILITVLLSLVLRPTPLVMYWCFVCVGFWHITFFSDPRSAPPPISDAIGAFLPTLFCAYTFWRAAFRFSLPALSALPLERTFWVVGGFWPGVLINLTFNKIPIDRLLGSDIKKRPGGVVALVVIAILLLVLVLNQMRVIRRTRRLPEYLGYYVLGGLTILVLAMLPGLTFRLHHYVFGMLLIPGTAFPTRISALLGVFLLGMFLNGVSKWGFASILQTAAELRRDAALGSALPSFITNMTYTPFSTLSTSNTVASLSTLFGSFSASLLASSASTLAASLAASNTTANSTLSWPAIPEKLTASEGWDGYSLLVDDVERVVANASAGAYDLTALDWSVRHFFRLAYQKQGSSGDYTRAATIFPNGTFVPPAAGPS